MGKNRRDIEKEKYWRRTIEEWTQSGKSAAAYCRIHGINAATFHWWKRELFIRDCQNLNGGSSHDTDKTGMLPDFAEVKVVQSKPVSTFREPPDRSEYSGLELVLSGNRRIRVYRGFDVSTLYHLLQVVEYPPC